MPNKTQVHSLHDANGVVTAHDAKGETMMTVAEGEAMLRRSIQKHIAAVAAEASRSIRGKASQPSCRSIQKHVAAVAATGDYAATAKALNRLIHYGRTTTPDGDWHRKGLAFKRWLLNPRVDAPFRIFQPSGNSKLPFVAFSTLPVVTCPGAGECAKWCYSFNCWRNANPFFRQVQNTLLLANRDDRVGEAFEAIPEGRDVRLYVDGDFDSAETVAYWFRLIHGRPDLQVYGYSKSWAEISTQSTFPSNYTLNLSSGSIWENDAEMLAKMEALPITRGFFLAVSLTFSPVEAKRLKSLKEAKYLDPGYKAAVRQAANDQGIERMFICPGRCGSCTKTVHACGSHRFDNVPVLIGIH